MDGRPESRPPMSRKKRKRAKKCSPAALGWEIGKAQPGAAGLQGSIPLFSAHSPSLRAGFFRSWQPYSPALRGIPVPSIGQSLS
jgi:hypothetical protein